MSLRLVAVAGRTVLLLGLLVAAALGSEAEAHSRPITWAQPVELEGVTNLHKVSEDLYRTAQPKPEGVEELEALGVKTIVSVRFFHSGRRPLEGTELIFERIAIMPWHPKEKQVVRFLQIATDPDQTPVLLHCYKGADRTGMLSAVYRIVVQGWTKDAAIEEMREGGYGFSPLWNNLVRWVENSDIERLRNEVGIPTLPEADPAWDPSQSRLQGAASAGLPIVLGLAPVLVLLGADLDQGRDIEDRVHHVPSDRSVSELGIHRCRLRVERRDRSD